MSNDSRHLAAADQRVTPAEQNEESQRDLSRGDGLSTIDQHGELPRRATSDSDRRLPEKP